MPKGADFILGGWQVKGIITFQKGTPLQIGNNGNFTNPWSPGQRPNNNGKSAKRTGPVENRLDSYFDQSVFSQAGNFTFGNTSRTSPDLRGLGSRDFDASIFNGSSFARSRTWNFARRRSTPSIIRSGTGPEQRSLRLAISASSTRRAGSAASSSWLSGSSSKAGLSACI